MVFLSALSLQWVPYSIVERCDVDVDGLDGRKDSFVWFPYNVKGIAIVLGFALKIIYDKNDLHSDQTYLVWSCVISLISLFVSAGLMIAYGVRDCDSEGLGLWEILYKVADLSQDILALAFLFLVAFEE